MFSYFQTGMSATIRLTITVTKMQVASIRSAVLTVPAGLDSPEVKGPVLVGKIVIK